MWYSECMEKRPQFDEIKSFEEYFKGNIIRKETKKSSPAKISDKVPLTLETTLVECNFRFSQHMRDFFSEQTGIKNFKFNTDMVATAKKVRESTREKIYKHDLLELLNEK